MKLTLKAPKSKLLKLEHEKVVSNDAFKFNLRRYSLASSSSKSATANNADNANNNNTHASNSNSNWPLLAPVDASARWSTSTRGQTVNGSLACSPVVGPPRCCSPRQRMPFN